jgi:hypothetical protein
MLGGTYFVITHYFFSFLCNRSCTSGDMLALTARMDPTVHISATRISSIRLETVDR